VESLQTLVKHLQQPHLARVQAYLAAPDQLAQVSSNPSYGLTKMPQVSLGVCPICQGTGFLRRNVPVGHADFGRVVACRCTEQERKSRRRQQLKELSHLGSFAEKRFETFQPDVPGLQAAFQMAVTFAIAPTGWLLLVGPHGCGKTHLAAAVAQRCLEAEAVVLFATVPDLLDYLRATFTPAASQTYNHRFAFMREAEVLVLDDLGTQQSSPWANEKLFQLLNHRYNASLPTVITANPKGLRATDARLRSRLNDRHLVTVLNLEHARDYRPHQKSRNAGR
jgi:DNA replication protein DnaC